MEKFHFEQAKIWLAVSHHTAETRTEQQRYAVAYTMIVLAIIKANDALTLKFIGKISKRHEDARQLFEELIKRNLVNAQYASYKQIIQEAIDNKAHVQYRGAFVGKGDYDAIERKGQKFLKMAAGQLGVVSSIASLPFALLPPYTA